MQTQNYIDREYAKTQVGKGWHGLIDECFAALPPGAWVEQVKEKFGGLRFYQYGGDDDKIDTICDRSYSICETCGKPGQARDIHGWLKTLCDECNDKA